MKYIKKINLLNEMFTEKEKKKIKKQYDKTYNKFTIKENNN